MISVLETETRTDWSLRVRRVVFCCCFCFCASSVRVVVVNAKSVLNENNRYGPPPAATHITSVGARRASDISAK